MAGSLGELVLSVLHCQACGEERPHRVRLSQDGIVETVCTACGRALSVPQRKSARLAFGPYTLGGGAPMLVHGRVPAAAAGAALSDAVRALAAAGCHVVEVTAAQAQDVHARRLAGEIPVALVVDAGSRLADAYRLTADAQAGRPGGWAAVRWVYDGSPGHLGLLLEAAARRGVALIVAVPLDEWAPDTVLRALRECRASLDQLVLEFFGAAPHRLVAAYGQAAGFLRSPFYGRFPAVFLRGAAGEEADPALAAFLRARQCDCLGAEGDGPAGPHAAQRALLDLWLPVAASPPHLEVTVAAGRQTGVLGHVRALETMGAWASVPGRVVRGLRSPAVGRLSARVLTKPVRFWHEVRREGPGVLLTVPRRVATKPVRLMQELRGGREPHSSSTHTASTHTASTHTSATSSSPPR
ncbi:MAG TPA: hypothetical protein VIK98_02560 [Limnochordales bacterium]